MTTDPLQLLRRLEPAVRPATAPAAARHGRAPFEQQGFDELLALVSTGAVTSGEPVRPSSDAGLGEPLDDDQLARLAAAADLARSAGARRAVMLIDGRSLVLDVARRELTAELTDGARTEVVELDAAVYVSAATDQTSSAGPLSGRVPAPGSGLVPPAVARQLIDADSHPNQPETAARAV